MTLRSGRPRKTKENQGKPRKSKGPAAEDQGKPRTQQGLLLSLGTLVGHPRGRMLLKPGCGQAVPALWLRAAIARELFSFSVSVFVFLFPFSFRFRFPVSVFVSVFVFFFSFFVFRFWFPPARFQIHVSLCAWPARARGPRRPRYLAAPPAPGPCRR